ncbi:hypothetical protein FANTH_4986 [Fusarium anthophilum]|uniref:Uncharacterized protein n=1 Tax=Fusarium anthophilum TaxID=48485 RepID=A0A8H5E786_9HYPO|nr:hypothetical protein FANTH_4986 [Fusarium anthophilum]
MCCGSSKDVKPAAERGPSSMGIYRNSYFPMKPKEAAEDKFQRDMYQAPMWHKKMRSQWNIQDLERFKGFPLPGEKRDSSSASSGRSSPAPVETFSSKARASASHHPNVPLGDRRPSIGRFDGTPAYGWMGERERDHSPQTSISTIDPREESKEKTSHASITVDLGCREKVEVVGES